MQVYSKDPGRRRSPDAGSTPRQTTGPSPGSYPGRSLSSHSTGTSARWSMPAGPRPWTRSRYLPDVYVVLTKFKTGAARGHDMLLNWSPAGRLA